MKKTFFLFILFGFLFSCTNEEDVITSVDNNVVQSSNIRTYDEALKIAKDAVGMLDGNYITRAASVNRQVADYREFTMTPVTRSSGTDSIDVRFYVINFKDNKGYALISADTRTTALYAYSDEGNLDMEDAISNTGFGDFMTDAVEYYKEEVRNYTPKRILPIVPSPTDSLGLYGDIPLLAIEELDGEYYHVRYGDTEIGEQGGNIIPATWHQRSPYNYYCDVIYDANGDSIGKAVAGCGPIALSQVMSYFQYPSSVNGNTFDWNAITAYPAYSYYNYGYNAKATAFLIKKVGEAAHADYGESTSTTANGLRDALSTFGYLYSGPSDFSYTNIRSSLSNSYPVVAMGIRDGDIGHVWVIDKYIRERYLVTYYYTYPPYDVYKRIYYSYPYYYHCNWGTVINSKTWCIDACQRGSNYNYCNNKKILYNIRPNN